MYVIELTSTRHNRVRYLKAHYKAKPMQLGDTNNFREKIVVTAAITVARKFATIEAAHQFINENASNFGWCFNAKEVQA